MPRVSVFARSRTKQEMSQGHLFLVGFPNCGKTTLFNRLTGASYKTVNYPGATTEIQVGEIRATRISVCDTPGIHSLIANAPDEILTRQILTSPADTLPGFTGKGAVAIVMDAAQIQRQLSLFKQLAPHFPNCIVLLTMSDIAQAKGISLSPSKLAAELGVAVFAVNGKTGEGVVQFALHLEALTAQPYPVICLPETLSTSEIASGFHWADRIFARIGSYSPTQNIDLDRLFLHPILGWFAFFGITLFFFWAVFALAAPITDMTDTVMSSLIRTAEAHLPHNAFSLFFTQGILSSMASVLIFVPQLVVLFLAIGLMESTGYLARGAALVDRPLSAIGLNGRSFVPLLTGYACAIPAMLAARTIPSNRERLLTLFIIPLMSCSARLPVYGLLIAMLTNSPRTAGILMTGIYILSFVVASIVAAIAGRLLRIEKTAYHGFQIELPEWRKPQIGVLLRHVRDQTWRFLRGAGPLIMLVGMGIWMIASFPSPDHSFAQMLGHWLGPVFAPIGVDWRVGVGLILSFAAREVFVSALTTMFAVSDPTATTSILQTLKAATFEGTSTLIFTPPTILGLILFFMVSMQCAATLAVARREMGAWRLPVIMTITYIALGYGLAACVVQIGRFF
jgi:ferrous iron transport protein B